MTTDLRKLIEESRPIQYGEEWTDRNGEVVYASEVTRELADSLSSLLAEHEALIAKIEDDNGLAGSVADAQGFPIIGYAQRRISAAVHAYLLGEES